MKKECLRQYRIDMCGNCEHYNEEEGICDAGSVQIEQINRLEKHRMKMNTMS